ncbi:uncharacterized protein LOC100679724 [Nasonia vitripennis]|uniref:DUF4806 domain-containing protein n=1 Tax=Nasonia vitripennis TaxID=7425 RepID=A0A7M7GGM0_NASVI|nr:uncharacterized protein LOC100679724 [Nasonia vitripennis]
MTTAKYKIVEFSDHSMSVVPTFWLHNHDKCCYWPPYKGQLKVDRAVIEMENPDKKKWSNYNVIKVRGQASDYQEALDNLKLLVTTSDADDIIKDASAYKSTRQKRARKKSESSSEDSEKNTPEKRPVKRFKTIKENKTSDKQSKDHNSSDTFSEKNDSEIETPPQLNVNFQSKNDDGKEPSPLNIRSTSTILKDIANGIASRSNSPEITNPTNTAGVENETPKGRRYNEKEKDAVLSIGKDAVVANIEDRRTSKQTQESDGDQTPIKSRLPPRSSRVLTRDEEIENRYAKSISQIETKAGENEGALNIAYFKEIIYLLSKQSTEIEEIKRQRFDSSKKCRSGKTKKFDWSTVLPFKDAGTFEAYSKKIEKDSEIEESLIELLKCLGGRDDRIKTNTIMEKIMTDSLGSKYSWKGQKGKEKLQDLKIAQVMLGTILQVTTETYTETDARGQIGSWLAGRKAKLDREKEKEQS